MNPTCIRETLETPVLGSYDVIVCGGGVAGVSAAVAARRRGASVLLLEKSVLFGGLATIGLISWYEPLCDGKGHRVMSGMPRELMELAIKYSFNTLGDAWKNSETAPADGIRCTSHFSHTMFSLALSEWLQAEGVEILLDTVVTAPHVCDGHVAGLFIENKDGRGFYAAKTVVDATGHADIAIRAGIPHEDGVSYLTYIGYYADTETARNAAERNNMLYLRKWMNSGSDLWGKGHPEELPYFHGISAKDQTFFVLEGQRRLLDKLRDQPGEKRDLTVLPSMAQYRKTCRIIGEYTLQEEDDGRSFPDSVAAAGDFTYRGRTYELPYRILYSASIDNLFAAGRIVSATGWAWDATRVIPVAVATGEAAGAAAALCVQRGVTNHALPVDALQESLSDAGVRLWLKDIPKD